MVRRFGVPQEKIVQKIWLYQYFVLSLQCLIIIKYKHMGLIIRANGTQEVIRPKNIRFTKEEVEGIVGGKVGILTIYRNKMLFANREVQDSGIINPLATFLSSIGDDNVSIRGDVFVCFNSECVF